MTMRTSYVIGFLVFSTIFVCVILYAHQRSMDVYRLKESWFEYQEYVVNNDFDAIEKVVFEGVSRGVLESRVEHSKVRSGQLFDVDINFRLRSGEVLYCADGLFFALYFVKVDAEWKLQDAWGRSVMFE